MEKYYKSSSVQNIDKESLKIFKFYVTFLFLKQKCVTLYLL